MKELPAAFISALRSQFGDADAERMVAAIGDEPVASVRFNPRKPHASIAAAEPVPWATDAWYLGSRPTFTFDPLFHAGCYYVQEASSMFLEQALRQQVLATSPHAVLDLCAAPGGKSTLLRSLLPDDCLLVSNEIMGNRAQILKENMLKWGHPACVVTNDAPMAFSALPNLFDLIVADVPCSGEGMFRKDDTAVSEWSPENVEVCCRRSRAILADCWAALKPGGWLVYSTCTFNVHEDEETVAWIARELGADVVPLTVPAEWGIGGCCPYGGEPLPVYHFLPGRARGEGFFLALLRKHDGDVACVRNNNKDRKGRERGAKALAVPAEWKQTLAQADDFQWNNDGATISTVPTCVADDVSLIAKHAHVLSSGVAVAELKGRNWVPAPSLAFSTALRTDAFPRAGLSYADALAYLRKETVTLPADVARGPAVVTYRDVPLGFVKNLGNRANNLFPADWRIRTTHLPSEPFKLFE